VFTPGDAQQAIALDQIEQRVTALLAQDVTHQTTQLMDILTQGKVFGGELDLITMHGNCRFYPSHEPQWHSVAMSSTNRPAQALTGLLLAAAGAVLFASKGLFSKALFHSGVDYPTLTALRALLALPLFALLSLRTRLSLRKVPARTLCEAACAGLLCYGAGALIDFHALELIDISIERALLFSYPALIVLWSALALRAWPRPAILVALALTWVGIMLVVGGFDAAAWKHNLTGSLMVLFCATTTAAYFLLGQRCIPALGSSGFTIVAMTAATAGVLIYYLFSHSLTAVAAVSAQSWLLLLALSVLCLFLPTLLQAEGIKRIGAVRGALAGTVGPPASLLMGALLLGERPHIWQMLGTVLVVAGVLVIARMRAL
jgi:drug/metabolite transporter (DMT)-like permease